MFRQKLNKELRVLYWEREKVKTSEMKDQTTFAGWDFGSIWDIDPAKNNGYPFLR